LTACDGPAGHSASAWGRDPAARVCNGTLFYDREIKLNTTAAEAFSMSWENEPADGLVCQRCGYLHTFVSGSVELWEPDGGYPDAD
jgi:hypothetical protein